MQTEREHIHNELREAGSKLGDLLQRDTMRTPEGYFESLEAAILAKTVEKDQKGGPRFRILNYVSAAAAMVLLAIGLWWTTGRDAAQPLHMQLAAMNDAELDAFMDEQLAMISYEELYLYLENDVQSIETNDLFSTELMDETSAGEKMQADLQEQVFTDAPAVSEALLEPHELETIETEELQEYINNELLFEDLGL